MKRIVEYVFILAITMIISGAQPFDSFAQEYYTKGQHRLVRSHYDSAFVSGVNAFAILQKFYPGFIVNWSRIYWDFGRFYSLKRDADNVDFFCKVGIFPSVEEAEEATLKHFEWHSTYYIEGPVYGKRMGDNCWYHKVQFEGDEKPRLNHILFLRKNAFIELDSGAWRTKNYIDIIPIALAIDSMLVYGSPYVTLENTLSPPVVTSIQLSKSVLKLNEETIMTISAYDPKGRKLEYERTPGVMKSDLPANMFLIRASHENWPEPFYGTRTIEAWVVNEDNFVSRKVSTQITF